MSETAWALIALYGVSIVLAMIPMSIYTANEFTGKWRRPRQHTVAVIGLSLIWPALVVGISIIIIVDFIKALITNDWDE